MSSASLLHPLQQHVPPHLDLQPLALNYVWEQLQSLRTVVAHHPWPRDSSLPAAVARLVHTVWSELGYPQVWSSLEVVDKGSTPIRTCQWSILYSIMELKTGIEGGTVTGPKTVVRPTPVVSALQPH